MRAHCIGHGPGLAAPEAASSGGTAGAASVVADAVAPAGLNAQKESALAVQAAQSREQNELSNSATGASADKAFFTLRALLALKGHVLSRTHGDDGPVRFYVTRWGLVRELRDIAAVRAFAEQVGATNA
jgi:hypothetical protein